MQVKPASWLQVRAAKLRRAVKTNLLQRLTLLSAWAIGNARGLGDHGDFGLGCRGCGRELT